jgi:hypothetical protein
MDTRDLTVHTCNPITWEAEVGELAVPGQPGTLSQNKTKQKIPLIWKTLIYSISVSLSPGAGD